MYYQDWHRTKRPKPAVEGGILPGVSHAVSPVPSTSTEVNTGLSSGFNSPRNTLSSTTGVVVSMNGNSNQLPNTSLLQSPSTSTAPSSTGLPFDEEAKLVYGVVISLRNMIKKISGRYVILLITSVQDGVTQEFTTLETNNLSITVPQDTSFTYLKPCQVTNL